MKKLILIILLIPSITFAQKKTYGHGYLGVEYFSNTIAGSRAGVTTGFGFGLNKYVAIGGAFDAFLLDQKKKFGEAKLDITYFVNGLDKKGTVYISIQPGYTIYSAKDSKGGVAFDGLIGGRVRFGKKNAGILVAVGYGRVTITEKYNDQIKFEGAKAKFAFAF